MHNTCVLVTEGLQGIQAMASSIGKHQDKISSLVNKIRIPSPGPDYAQPLAPLKIKEGSGKGRPVHPSPSCGGLWGYEQVQTGKAVPQAVLCPKEASGERAAPLETNGFRGAHALFLSTWPWEVLAPLKLSLGLMEFLSEWKQIKKQRKITSALYLLVIKKKK